MVCNESDDVRLVVDDEDSLRVHFTRLHLVKFVAL
jgi:hypothetical protein